MKGSYVLEPAPAAPVHDGGENRELLACSRRPPYQPTGDLEGGAGFRASGRLPPARPDAKGRAADAGGKGAGAACGGAVCSERAAEDELLSLRNLDSGSLRIG